MTADQETAWKQIEAAAKQEGSVTYYSVGTIPQGKVEEFRALWNQDYPDIKLEFLYVGRNSEMAARLNTEQSSKNYVCDVADASVRSSLVLNAAYEQLFIPPAAVDPSVKWVSNPVGDPEGKGRVIACAGQFFAIWTNSNLIKPDDAPKTMLDVAKNPKFKGQILWQTPWVSGGGQHLYRFAKQVYGSEWITGMQGQDVTFSEDQDAALLQIARGEYGIGLAMTGRTAGQLLKDGQPIAPAWPEDFVIKSSQGAPLLTGAPHTNAAKVLINWFLTEKGQRFWQSLGQFPYRADIPPAEPWMQGVSRAKQIFENLAPPDQEEANEKAAAADFKR